ncbi:hypothetical protein A2V82_16555 [candidate division KSB1 bacterium RBG_16_48_16]|nr:MAG: hypothetical protein A2V82_16555 [candidate division KSB1 bacterium RBG_16_48_16]
MSRTATLDGGCIIEDNGLSHSDRTFRIISSSLTKEDAALLGQMIEFYAVLYLSTPDGVFSGAIENLGYSNGTVTASFLVKEKLT